MQTYKTKNPSQHHTPSTHKHAHKDAAKKKDARVHYTVLTQHTHTTTTTHHKQRSDHSRAGQQDNHNHTHQQARAGHVLPQTPNSMPTYPKPCLRNTWLPPAPHKAEASNPAGAHPPGIYTKQKSGSHTLGDINHQPTTVGTKTKAP